eukprot:2996023-Alexandrium_andersonii.AAC.1
MGLPRGSGADKTTPEQLNCREHAILKKLEEHNTPQKHTRSTHKRANPNRIYRTKQLARDRYEF